MLKANRTLAASSQLKLGASVIALLTVFGTGAAYAQAAGEQMETVVVTGFRASLEKALDMKRNALDSSELDPGRRYREIPGHERLGISATHSGRRAHSVNRAKDAKSPCAASARNSPAC